MSRWEKYAAIVTQNDDPELPSQGRIFVKCIELMGDEDTEYPESIPPAFDWGWFYVPDIGEEVEIEVLASDKQSESASAAAFTEQGEVRWRGVRFLSEEGEAPRPIDPLFTAKNYGKRRGFATPEGHVFLFDDTEDDKQIILTWKKTKDGSDYTQLTMDKEGSILLMTHNSMMLHLNAKSGQEGITALDKHTNLIATDKNGIKVADKHSNFIELKDGQIQIIGSGDINVQAAKALVMNSAGSGEKVKFELKDDGNLNVTAEADVKIACVNAELNATGNYKLHDTADSPLVRWLELQPWLDTHVHATAFGPSGPASAAPTGPVPPAAASTKGTLK